MAIDKAKLISKLRKAPPAPVADAPAQKPVAKLPADLKLKPPPRVPNPPLKQEQVQFKCGCIVGVKFLTDKPCPACLKKLKKGRAQRRYAKRAAQGQAPSGSSWKKWEKKARLPDGAAFAIAYDAATTSWTGTLTIDLDGKKVTLTGSATAAFRLLADLDGQYRALVTPPAEPKKQGDGA